MVAAAGNGQGGKVPFEWALVTPETVEEVVDYIGKISTQFASAGELNAWMRAEKRSMLDGLAFFERKRVVGLVGRKEREIWVTLNPVEALWKWALEQIKHWVRKEGIAEPRLHFVGREMSIPSDEEELQFVDFGFELAGPRGNETAEVTHLIVDLKPELPRYVDSILVQQARLKGQRDGLSGQERHAERKSPPFAPQDRV